MRNFLLLFVVLFIFISCKKDTSLKNNIEGKWELKTRYGGWIGTQNFSPGNGNTIEFTETSYKMEFNINDTATYSVNGQYEVYDSAACNGMGQTTYIRYISSSPASNYSEDAIITNDELIIGKNSCIADGVTSIYTKLR